MAEAKSVAEAVGAELAAAFERAVGAGALPGVDGSPDIVVEKPKDPAHGDAATNLALRLARSVSLAPRRIADVLCERLGESALIESVDVAGPGFINIRLRPSWLVAQLAGIIAADQRWGDVPLAAGGSVQVEFVSANPTGPVTLGATRGAAVGDALANVLAAAGYRVEREYYVNDSGSRMETFFANCSWYYRLLCGVEEPPPPDPYPAAEHAAQLLFAEHGAALRDLDTRLLGEHGIAAQLAEIRQDLERLGVRFDGWFHEQSLFDGGAVDAMMERLRSAGCVVERDGAVWFAATSVGLDKDEVLVRSNGMPTYFMSDVAYHLDKLERRGFDRAVDVVGADHQGHLPRMFAALRVLGIDDSRVSMVVTQLITVGGSKMKKSAGHYVTLREVLEQVGGDAIRFFLISRSTGSTIDFDLDLAAKAGNDNPVFYVQMAHARCAGVFRQAEADGIATDSPDPALLGADESPLIQLLLDLPEVVRSIARDLEPHRLTFYAHDLAAAWHRYYHDHRIVDTSAPALSTARLHLAAAVRVTLARTLHLMGMSAPDRM
ncbi:MAG TPA: arginine--tRNA ligase [Candidatus Dormibacteraeota bacterium]|nr:arginine--tRNA ligase [Candidatus Dormibacteraeota bacterium]